MLERRTMLSGNTYTPTVFTDDYNLALNDSLRDAIIDANADPGTATDTIVLSSGTYSLTIPNVGEAHENAARTGYLDITSTAHALVIEGRGDSGPNPAIIDQIILDRVFEIASNVTVTFENLEITGAAVDTGAAGDGAAATIFEALATADTKVTRSILVEADKVADELGLDDALCSIRSRGT